MLPREIHKKIEKIQRKSTYIRILVNWLDLHLFMKIKVLCKVKAEFSMTSQNTNPIVVF